MKHVFARWLVSISISVACAPALAQTPTAVLDAPTRIERGSELFLRGHQSADPNGTIVQFRWQRLSGTGGVVPVGELFHTVGPTFAVLQSTVNPLNPGGHDFELRVVDNEGNVSAPVVRTVVVVDTTAPTAVLDVPARLPLGTPLVLDGSRSVDADGPIAKYEWVYLSGSGGPMVVNQVLTTQTPTFAIAQAGNTPLAIGRHTFSLRVVDESGNQSAPANAVVVVVDTTAPTAVLDVPARLPLGTPLVLDGSRSVDADGPIAKYEWVYLSGSGGPMVVNQVLTTQTPTFAIAQAGNTPLALGRHTFSLRVVDASGNRSAPANAVVVVVDTTAPTAVLDVPARLPLGTPLVLDGSRSVDADGPIAKYEWVYLSGSGGPMVVNQVLTTQTPTFAIAQAGNTPLALGRHTFSLRVVDASGNRSAPANAVVAVVDTGAPTAVLDVPARLPFGRPLVLNGSRSSDAEDAISRYEWTRIEGSGGAMTINTPVTTETSGYTVPQSGAPLLVGRHRFSLVVEDTSGNRSAPAVATLMVVDNVAPVAVLDAPERVIAGASLTLSGKRSTDVGGTIARYEWTRFGGATTATTDPVFTIEEPLSAGTHAYRLVVTDDSGNTSRPADRKITVDRPAPPVANLSAPKSVSFGAAFKLEARRSRSAAGDLRDYRWTRVSGKGGSLAAGRTTRTRVPVLTIKQPKGNAMPPGTHRFRLVVVDALGSASKPVERDVVVTK